MSLSTERRSASKLTITFAGLGALLWLALLAAPYVYAINDLIQWR